MILRLDAEITRALPAVAGAGACTQAPLTVVLST